MPPCCLQYTLKEVAIELKLELTVNLPLCSFSSITFDEFDQYMSTRERELEAIFKQVDVDNDGSITAEEMAAGLTLLGHSFTPEDVHVMMNKVWHFCNLVKGKCYSTV